MNSLQEREAWFAEKYIKVMDGVSGRAGREGKRVSKQASGREAGQEQGERNRRKTKKKKNISGREREREGVCEIGKRGEENKKKDGGVVLIA